MTAYSFKRQFVEPIRARTKQQTIRAYRTGRGRHARPGEALQLYFGMRTKHCEKIIPDPVCTEVVDVVIDLRAPGRPLISVGGVPLNEKQADVFARADGFENRSDMVVFWLAVHGRVRFEGVCIKWQDAPT